MNDFYVYEYVRLDTNEPFYIGKGHGRRWRELKVARSKHFQNICKSVGAAVVILHENLTDQEANEIECWYIWQLRDVQGYDLINGTDGGEGIAGYKHTEETKQILREKLKVNHGMLGAIGLKSPRLGKGDPMFAILPNGEKIEAIGGVELSVKLTERGIDIPAKIVSTKTLYGQKHRKTGIVFGR
jgi:hypothetical protein